MNRMYSFSVFPSLLKRKPQAYAVITGNDRHPTVHGTVRFYQTPYGVLVAAEFTGLPSTTGECASPVFGLHIHSGSSCTGTTAEPFADTRSRCDPNGCPHPYHAGDLPPLFGASGRAFAAFLTDRFSLQQIIGRTVIVHASPDDYTTQPSGNSGERIGCGQITAIK